MPVSGYSVSYVKYNPEKNCLDVHGYADRLSFEIEVKIDQEELTITRKKGRVPKKDIPRILEKALGHVLYEIESQGSTIDFLKSRIESSEKQRQRLIEMFREEIAIAELSQQESRPTKYIDIRTTICDLPISISATVNVRYSNHPHLEISISGRYKFPNDERKVWLTIPIDGYTFEIGQPATMRGRRELNEVERLIVVLAKQAVTKATISKAIKEYIESSEYSIEHHSKPQLLEAKKALIVIKAIRPLVEAGEYKWKEGGEK